MLNKRKKSFMLDTGSSYNLISKAALTCSGPAPAHETFFPDMVLNTFTGTLKGELARFDEIRLGGHAERNTCCCILAHEDYFSALAPRMKSDISGVLGYDFLRDKSIGIDFPGRKLLFRADPTD